MERVHTHRRPKPAAIVRSRADHQAERRHHQRELAILRFREWDRAMTRQHGPMYHRKLGYTLH